MWISVQQILYITFSLSSYAIKTQHYITKYATCMLTLYRLKPVVELLGMW